MLFGASAVDYFWDIVYHQSSFRLLVDTVHYSRRPEGQYRQRKWFPGPEEDRFDSFRGVRRPTRMWPRSLLRRAFSRDHCRLLVKAFVFGYTVPEDVRIHCFNASEMRDLFWFSSPTRLRYPMLSPEKLRLLPEMMDDAWEVVDLRFKQALGPTSYKWFLAACRENPADAAPWLVASDAMQDRGDGRVYPGIRKSFATLEKV